MYLGCEEAAVEFLLEHVKGSGVLVHDLIYCTSFYTLLRDRLMYPATDHENNSNNITEQQYHHICEGCSGWYVGAVAPDLEVCLLFGCLRQMMGLFACAFFCLDFFYKPDNV